MLKLRASGPKELQRLLAEVREKAQSSRSVTSIVLSTIKEETAISPASGDEADE